MASRNSINHRCLKSGNLAILLINYVYQLLIVCTECPKFILKNTNGTYVCRKRQFVCILHVSCILLKLIKVSLGIPVTIFSDAQRTPQDCGIIQGSIGITCFIGQLDVEAFNLNMLISDQFFKLLELLLKSRDILNRFSSLGNYNRLFYCK